MTSNPPRRHAALKVVVRRDDAVIWSGHFHQREITIGRSPASDVVLDDPLVSWTHARVAVKRPGGITFTDQSANGSFRHGNRVGEAVLGRGGVVGVPPFEIDFSIEMAVRESPNTDPVPRAQTSDPSRGPATPIAEPAEPLIEAEMRLVQAPGSLLGAVFEIPLKPVLIGRADDCDIRLDLPSISRQHARLIPAGEARWTVQDAGSRNGVEVNGAVITSAEVNPGDRISFGPEVVAMLQVRRPEKPAPARAPDPAPPVVSTDTVTDGLLVSKAASATHPRIMVVRVAGRVDGYGYAYLREEIARVVDDGARFVIVDLSKCTYCDHAGLGVLVNAQVALSQHRGAMRLVGLSRQLHDAFLLLRLDQMLSIAADEPIAAAELERLMR